MKKNLILQTILALSLATFLMCGCSEATQTSPAEQATATTAEETVAVTAEETVAVTAEEPTEEIAEKTEPVESEEQKTEMIDWKTFATQADNNEICMVVSNESKNYQKVLIHENGKESFEYEIQEGDKFAIPIRKEIFIINYFTDISNGAVQIDFSPDMPYVEFEMEEGRSYQVNIYDNNQNPKFFVLRLKK